MTYSLVPASGSELDLVELRRALGALTQVEAAHCSGLPPTPGRAGNAANSTFTQLELTSCAASSSWSASTVKVLSGASASSASAACSMASACLTPCALLAWMPAARRDATNTRATARAKEDQLHDFPRGGDFVGHRWGHPWPPVDTSMATSGAFAVAIDR